MKILIYVVVFFIYSALEPFMSNASYAIATTLAYDADTVGLICGALAAARAVFAYCCARWLCKHRHQRQAEKAALAASESHAPVPPPAESEPTIADPTSPAPATPKLRYCKLCGAPIDPVTRKCTDCRKQYFRLPHLNKKHLFIGAAALACAVFVFLVFNLVSQKNTALSKVDQLTTQIAELENAVAEKDRQIEVYKRDEDAYQVKLTRKTEEYNKLREENSELKDDLGRYESIVVVVGDTGDNIYHILGCPYMKIESGFYIYGIGQVMTSYYAPCPYCYS